MDIVVQSILLDRFKAFDAFFTMDRIKKIVLIARLSALALPAALVAALHAAHTDLTLRMRASAMASPAAAEPYYSPKRLVARLVVAQLFEIFRKTRRNPIELFLS